mmetsp:Transcript_4306/g.18308  ORF Transcript_4306/g.18308 Transcript_4306/m.18308 type:complete len:236 (+) Transcript_4306:3328-4035(+)
MRATMSCSLRSFAMHSRVVACRCTTRATTSGHATVWMSPSESCSLRTQNARISNSGLTSTTNRAMVQTRYAVNSTRYASTRKLATKPLCDKGEAYVASRKMSHVSFSRKASDVASVVASSLLVAPELRRLASAHSVLSVSQSTYSSRNALNATVKPRVRTFTTRDVTMHQKPLPSKYAYRAANHLSRFSMRNDAWLPRSSSVNGAFADSGSVSVDGSSSRASASSTSSSMEGSAA